MKRFLLKGSTSRKIMAGMKVRYASAPSMWSLSPPVATEAGSAAATGFPQAGQKALMSGICAPHWEQLRVNRLPLKYLRVTGQELRCSRGRTLTEIVVPTQTEPDV